MIDQGPVVRHRCSANVDFAKTARSRGAGASVALGSCSDRDISLRHAIWIKEGHTKVLLVRCFHYAMDNWWKRCLHLERKFIISL